MTTNTRKLPVSADTIGTENTSVKTETTLATGAVAGQLGRRDFLRLAGTLTVAAPVLSAFLASCGDDDDDDTNETGDTGDTGDTTTGGNTDTDTGTGTDTATDTGGTTDTDGTDTGETTDTGSTDNPAPNDGGTETVFDPEALSANVTLFPYGVQAGVPTQTTALIWGYVEGNTAARPLRIWRASETAGNVVLVKDLTPAPDADGYFKLLVDGLSPGQTYFYAFFDGAAPTFTTRSTIGRFKTAYADGVKKAVTIAATTCTNYANRPYTSLILAAKEDLDAFLQLGDWSYMDDPAAESTVKTAAVTQAEYDELWGITLKETGYQAILARTGMYATLDDHEVVDSGGFYNLPPERYDTAMKSFFQHTAVPNIEDAGDKFRFWQSYQWGDSVEFFVLDSRLGRKPDTRRGPDAEYLSKEQMTWLKAGLKASTAHFKVLLNSVPITDFTFAVSEEDRWEGFAAQRNELLDHITDEDIRNVWFLTGDFHFANVARVDNVTSGPRRRIREIMVGPGASKVNPLKIPYERGDQKAKDSIFPPGQFEFVSFATANATVLTFDPAKNTVRVKFVDSKTEAVLFDKELSEDDA